MMGEGGNSRRGFTLIEIMVAIAVVAISFLSFYRLFSQTVAADSLIRFYTVAPLLAQQKMAEIISGTAPADYNGSGTFENYPGYRWQVRILEVSSESLGTAVADMKQVDLTIARDGDARSFPLRTYAFLRN